MPKRKTIRSKPKRGGAVSAKIKTAIKKIIRKIRGGSMRLPGTGLPYLTL